MSTQDRDLRLTNDFCLPCRCNLCYQPVFQNSTYPDSHSLSTPAQIAERRKGYEPVNSVQESYLLGRISKKH
ncbi:MAG: hypothetical protein AB2L21_04290 [Anaerolineaceae bacterium]